MIASALIGVMVVFALFIGIDTATASVTRILGPTFLAGVIGLLLAVLGFGGVISIATHPHRPGTTWVQKVFAVVVLVLLGILGVTMLVYANGQAPGTSGF